MSLSLLLATATPQAAPFPQPEFFIPMTESALPVFGFGECLANYGWHLLKGTMLPVEEVVRVTTQGCEVVRDAAFRNLTGEESPIRRLVAEETGSDFDSLAFNRRIAEQLVSFEERWVTSFVEGADAIRAAEDYDPVAFMEQYNAQVAAGEMGLNDDD